MTSVVSMTTWPLRQRTLHWMVLLFMPTDNVQNSTIKLWGLTLIILTCYPFCSTSAWNTFFSLDGAVNSHTHAELSAQRILNQLISRLYVAVALPLPIVFFFCLPLSSPFLLLLLSLHPFSSILSSVTTWENNRKQCRVTQSSIQSLSIMDELWI